MLTIPCPGLSVSFSWTHHYTRTLWCGHYIHHNYNVFLPLVVLYSQHCQEEVQWFNNLDQSRCTFPLMVDTHFVSPDVFLDEYYLNCSCETTKVSSCLTICRCASESSDWNRWSVTTITHYSISTSGECAQVMVIPCLIFFLIFFSGAWDTAKKTIVFILFFFRPVTVTIIHFTI